MIINESWCNEKYLKRLFTWQTKYLNAPFFGNCPIGYYQIEQERINKNLINYAKKIFFEARIDMFIECKVQKGNIIIKIGDNWEYLISVYQLNRL